MVSLGCVVSAVVLTAVLAAALDEIAPEAEEKVNATEAPRITRNSFNSYEAVSDVDDVWYPNVEARHFPVSEFHDLSTHNRARAALGDLMMPPSQGGMIDVMPHIHPRPPPLQTLPTFQPPPPMFPPQFPPSPVPMPIYPPPYNPGMVQPPSLMPPDPDWHTSIDSSESCEEDYTGQYPMPVPPLLTPPHTDSNFIMQNDQWLLPGQKGPAKFEQECEDPTDVDPNDPPHVTIDKVASVMDTIKNHLSNLQQNLANHHEGIHSMAAEKAVIAKGHLDELVQLLMSVAQWLSSESLPQNMIILSNYLRLDDILQDLMSLVKHIFLEPIDIDHNNPMFG